MGRGAGHSHRDPCAVGSLEWPFSHEVSSCAARRCRTQTVTRPRAGGLKIRVSRIRRESPSEGPRVMVKRSESDARRKWTRRGQREVTSATHRLHGTQVTESIGVSLCYCRGRTGCIDTRCICSPEPKLHPQVLSWASSGDARSPGNSSCTSRPGLPAFRTSTATPERNRTGFKCIPRWTAILC